MDEFASGLQYDDAMTTAGHPPEKRPMRIGLRRYSAAEFLVALVVLLIVAPFVELFRNGLLVESVLMTLVLVSGVLAVGKSRRTLVVAIIFVTPALVARWTNHLRPDLVSVEFALISGLLFITFLILCFLAFILRAPRVNSEVLCAGVSTYLLLGLLWSFAYRAGDGTGTRTPLLSPWSARRTARSSVTSRFTSA